MFIDMPRRASCALGFLVLFPACAAVRPVEWRVADGATTPSRLPGTTQVTAETEHVEIVEMRPLGRVEPAVTSPESRVVLAANLTPGLDRFALDPSGCATDALDPSGRVTDARDPSGRVTDARSWSPADFRLRLGTDPGEPQEILDSQERRRRSWRDQPRGRMAISLGLVDLEHEEIAASGAKVLDDEARASALKFEFEGFRRGFGGGISLELISVRDDLHDNAVGVSSSDTDSWELFGHFSARPVGGNKFRMPIRFGPFMHGMRQDLNGASPDEVDYFTFGIRVEIEPEFDIYREDDSALSVFWGGKLFSGVALVDVETTTFDETFDTTVAGYGLTTGVRFSARRFFTQAAYVYNFRRFDESDAEFVGGLFQTANEAEFTYDGFMFSMGLRW
jgi:hypothetical protein